jgi:hypothetical protein
MKELEVIAIVRKHVEQKFPMTCSTCGHRFASLKEYLEYTTHLGNPISYDAESGNWRPWEPVGTLSFANCRCGTTLSLSSHGMGLFTLWRLLRWAREESSCRGISVGELLEDLRKKIDHEVLKDKEPGKETQAGR